MKCNSFTLALHCFLREAGDKGQERGGWETRVLNNGGRQEGIYQVWSNVIKCRSSGEKGRGAEEQGAGSRRF